jgi:hypothetical protein
MDLFDERVLAALKDGKPRSFQKLPLNPIKGIKTIFNLFRKQARSKKAD